MALGRRVYRRGSLMVTGLLFEQLWALRARNPVRDFVPQHLGIPRRHQTNPLLAWRRSATRRVRMDCPEAVVTDCSVFSRECFLECGWVGEYAGLTTWISAIVSAAPRVTSIDGDIAPAMVSAVPEQHQPTGAQQGQLENRNYLLGVLPGGSPIGTLVHRLRIGDM